MQGVKPEFPPLFSKGFHTHTMPELHDLLVLKFPRSKTRGGLWKSLEWLVSELIKRGIKCRLWIDGSLITEKNDPDDIDFVVCLDVDFLNALNQSQKDFVTRLSAQDFRSAPLKLHSFIIFSAPAGHVMWPNSEVLRKRWEKDFGFSLVKKKPKGIVILEVSI